MKGRGTLITAILLVAFLAASWLLLPIVGAYGLIGLLVALIGSTLAIGASSTSARAVGGVIGIVGVGIILVVGAA